MESSSQKSLFAGLNKLVRTTGRKSDKGTVDRERLHSPLVYCLNDIRKGKTRLQRLETSTISTSTRLSSHHACTPVPVCTWRRVRSDRVTCATPSFANTQTYHCRHAKQWPRCMRVGALCLNNKHLAQYTPCRLCCSSTARKSAQSCCSNLCSLALVNGGCAARQACHLSLLRRSLSKPRATHRTN